MLVGVRRGLPVGQGAPGDVVPHGGEHEQCEASQDAREQDHGDEEREGQDDEEDGSKFVHDSS